MLVDIENIGKAKAREVYVELNFPSFLLVLEKRVFSDLEKPSLDIPDNPIWLARQRYVESQKRSLFTDLLGSSNYLPTIPDIRPIGENIFVPKARSIVAEGNKVTIWLKDLLHTRRISFNGVLLIPQSDGIGNIEGTIICEEMTTPLPISIPMVVRGLGPQDLTNPAGENK